MAERFEMNFKNPELKMWFIVMTPFIVIGGIALLMNDPSTRYVPFLSLIIGYAIYYIWRFRFRKKKQKAAGR